MSIILTFTKAKLLINFNSLQHFFPSNYFCFISVCQQYKFFGKKEYHQQFFKNGKRTQLELGIFTLHKSKRTFKQTEKSSLILLACFTSVFLSVNVSREIMFNYADGKKFQPPVSP